MKNPGLERFPLGFWGTLDANLAPADQPAEWAEMGMTLTMGHCYNHGETDKAHFTAMLDSAQQHGVRIILCDKRAGARELRTLGEDGYRRQLQEVIDDWGTHPAIWGVHLGDEPDAADYELFVKAIRMLREMAPQWEPYANLLPWFPHMEEHVNAADWPSYLDGFVRDSGIRFLSYDCYTQMRSDPEALPIYFRNLKLYGDAARRNNIPFWTILLSVPHFQYRDPSLDDIRWQFNTALACGAKGISWFFIYCQQIWNSNYRNAPVNQVGRKTQGYYNISDVQNIFWHTLGPVMNRLALQKVYHIGQAYGGFELFCGDEEVALTGGPQKMIMSYFSDEDDPTWKYILLVNNSCTENVNYTLTLRGADVQAEQLTHNDIWRPMCGALHDDGEVIRTQDTLQLPHWYAPGQAILYRYRRP